MKTKLLRSLAVTAVLGLFTSLASAGPGIQHWQTLRNARQFHELKAGDKIAYICNQCNTVSESTVASSEKAMELCKEGAKVHCPACQKETRVVVKQRRNDPVVTTEVTYVNDKGEPCLFVAKTTDAN